MNWSTNLWQLAAAAVRSNLRLDFDFFIFSFHRAFSLSFVDGIYNVINESLTHSLTHRLLYKLTCDVMVMMMRRRKEGVWSLSQVSYSFVAAARVPIHQSRVEIRESRCRCAEESCCGLSLSLSLYVLSISRPLKPTVCLKRRERERERGLRGKGKWRWKGISTSAAAAAAVFQSLHLQTRNDMVVRWWCDEDDSSGIVSYT